MPAFLGSLAWYVVNKSFQIVGWKSISIGNSSRRPANISKISTIFEKFEKNAKFPVGPTRLIPGPILLIVAITDVNIVEKSRFSNDNKITLTKNTSINVPKNTLLERIVS